MTEYALTVDGLQYKFLTAGAPSSGITATYADGVTTDPSWSTSSGTVYVVGALAYPRGSIGFRMRPQDGGVEADGQTFTLHDVRIDDATPRLVTFLGTRLPSLIASTVLTTTIASTDVGPATFDVSDASGIMANDVLWIDQEAIEVDAPTGNTLPILTRGVYGSRAVDHAPYQGLYPTVWREFPFLTRRRCILWRIVGSVATAKWRGYITDNARSGNGEHAAAYVIQAHHTWDRIKDFSLGVVDASCKIRGIDSKTLRAGIHYGDADSFGVDTYLTGGSVMQAPVIWSSADVAATALQAELERQLGAVVTSGDFVRPAIVRAGANIRFSCRFGGTSRDNATIRLNTTGAPTTDFSPAVSNGTDSVATTSAPCPIVLRSWPVNTAGQRVEIDDASNLPASWTQVITASTTGNWVVSIQPVLRAEYNDTSNLTITPTSTTYTGAGAPYVTGTIALVPKAPGIYTPESLGVTVLGGKLGQNAGGVLVDHPTSMVVAYKVRAEHWFHVLRYPVIGDTSYNSQTPSPPLDYLASGADPRDWDFSTEADVIRHTAGAPFARTLWFDGQITLGAFVIDTCVYNGCALGVSNDGRLRVVPVRPPVPSDTLATTVRGSDYARADARSTAAPEWIPLPEMLANSVQIQAKDTTVNVNDRRSQALYGRGRELSVKLYGVDNLGTIGSITDVGRSLLQRVFGLWSEPCGMARVKLTRAKADTVALGSFVQITGDWFIPAGDGTRGLAAGTTYATATRGIGQVVEKDEGLGDGLLTLGVLIFGLVGFAGYAPCCRVSGISANVVTVSKSFLSLPTSTKNYANTDASSGDGGASLFKTGDKAQFTLRGSTTYTTVGGFTVASTGPGNIITLTTNPGFSVSSAADGWDLIYDSYDTVATTDAEKRYAFVGDEATQLIGSSSDTAPRWAP